MMKLHSLQPKEGSRKKRKIIGRGQASGTGGTSGKGHKGQKARSGGSIRPGFEGGQMPLKRRLPKFGFNNKNFRAEYDAVNLDTLEKMSIDGDISAESLTKIGLIKGKLPLKILGRGELTKALNISAAKFSKSAVEKIEKAGGKAMVG